VNGKTIARIFPRPTSLQHPSKIPLQKERPSANLQFPVKVSGGGSHSQAEAVRHGIAPRTRHSRPAGDEERKHASPKKQDFLKRTQRAKERPQIRDSKRHASSPQWSKRVKKLPREFFYFVVYAFLLLSLYVKELFPSPLPISFYPKYG